MKIFSSRIIALAAIAFTLTVQGCDNGQNKTDESDDSTRIVLPGEKDTSGSTGPDSITKGLDSSEINQAVDTPVGTKKEAQQ